MKQQRLEHLFNMKLSAGFVSIICVIVYTSFPHGHTLLDIHLGLELPFLAFTSSTHQFLLWHCSARSEIMPS